MRTTQWHIVGAQVHAVARVVLRVVLIVGLTVLVAGPSGPPPDGPEVAAHQQSGW